MTPLSRLKTRLLSTIAAAAILAAPIFAAPMAAAAETASSTSSSLGFSAFAQAVAEAALRHDEVAAFYRETGYEPVWTGQTEAEKTRLTALLKAIMHAEEHGLPQSAYDTTQLTAMMRNISSPRDQGRVEVDLTNLFLTYAHQIQTGILEPSSIDKLMTRNPHRRDPVELLTGFLEAENPDAFMHSLIPSSDEYARLMHKKFEIERLVERGGWGPQVQAGALKPGEQGPGVVQLRNRLIAMGYLGRSATMTYDAEIQRAVQLFQENMGLNADGVAGPATIEAINVPALERLKSVVVAMERERWLSIDRKDRYIWVNLTDFTARIVDGGEITFETRSVVGANTFDRRTPEFSDVMEHMVINPSWYVPKSIARNEYVPAMIASQGTAAGHLQILDGAGRVIPRETIDWTVVTPSYFPFDLKQPPSGGNALGRVKFMFPNKHNIYLHDTPSKSLFSREVRAFSHGCVRLQKPFDFAYALLAAQEEDPEGTFQSILRTGRETTVKLETPLPVHLVYRTAFSDLRGHMGYRADIYGRDAKLWSALQDTGVSLPGLGS